MPLRTIRHKIILRLILSLCCLLLIAGCDQIRLTLPPTETATQTPLPSRTPTETATPTPNRSETRAAVFYRATVRDFQTQSAIENATQRAATPKPPATPSPTPEPTPTEENQPEFLEIDIANIGSLEQVGLFETGPIQSARFNEPDRTLQVRTGDALVLYDMVFLREKISLEKPPNIVVSVTENGSYAAYAGLSRKIALMDLRTGETEVVSSQPNAITALAFSPAENWIASLNINGRLILTHWTSGKELASIFIPFYAQNAALGDSMGFSPDGSRLAAYSNKGNSVLIWDVESLLSGQGDPAIVPTRVNPFTEDTAVFSPDWGVLAWVAGRTLRSFDVEAGELLPPFEHEDTFFGLTFLANGQSLIAGTTETINDFVFGAIYQFGAADLLLEKTIVYKVPLRDFELSPDGRRIAAGYEDGSIRLWDANTFEQIYELQGHTAPVTSLAFSPDDRILASVSQDGTLRFWGVASGGTVFVTPSGAQPEIFFTPDQKFLVLVEAFGQVRILAVSP